MAWTAPSTATFLQVSFMATEVTMIKSLGGNGDLSATFLQLAVDAMRGYIRAGGYPVDNNATNTAPPSLHREIYAIARWDMLSSLPQLKTLQTEDRKKAADDAHKKGDEIAAQRFQPETAIDAEPPAQHTGSWNSEQKLIMRTHAVPPPGVQYPGTGSPSPYANPDAPVDPIG